MDELDQYYRHESKLIEDLPYLTYDEALIQCKKLWKLIPINIEVNPVQLMDAMEKEFGNDPDWGKDRVTYTINIGTTSDDEMGRFISKLNDVLAKFVPRKYLDKDE
jgi:hypothetical protein